MRGADGRDKEKWGGSTGKAERKSGAFVHLGLHPDSAAVAMDDALRNGKPDAGALEFLGRVQTLENAEKLVGIGHVETAAVVVYRVDQLSLLPTTFHLDEGLLLFARVFEDVRKQVDENLLKQGDVADAIG